MAVTCACGSATPPKKIIPVWLVVVLFFCAILPGIAALYCHNRLIACPECGRVRWQF